VLALLTGLTAGLLHVWSGPDHLAAVAPLAVAQRRSRGAGWLTGLRWGLGHAGGALLVGLASLLLREALPLAWLSAWSERVVGVVLIGIGLWGLRQAFSKNLHAHEHSHDDASHVHVHAHRHANAHQHSQPAHHRHTHAAFAVGTLHGLAGSSHLLGVLPALAFPSPIEAAIYLVAFGLGTVAGMVAFSSACGWLASRPWTTGLAGYRGVMGACALAALAVGGFWLVA
jgi:sulfite exporter TauE/SafE